MASEKEILYSARKKAIKLIEENSEYFKLLGSYKLVNS